MDSSAKTDILFKDFWKWRLQNSPEFATFCGVHNYDDKLQNYSLQALEKGKIRCREFLRDALDILHDLDLKNEVKQNLQYFALEMKTYADGFNSKGYFFTVSYFDGPHNEFGRLINAMPRSTDKDFNNILCRYKELPAQLSEIINVMKQGVSQSMVFHKISVAAIPEQIDLHINVLEEKPEDCVFYKPFLSIPDSFTVDEKQDLLHKAKESLVTNVLPALKSFKDFFEKEYLNQVRPEIAVSSLPNGKEFYQMCLDYHLTCYMTPAEVHEMGLKEVDRILSEMTKVIKSLNLEMSVKDFSNMIRKDERFYFKDPQELLKEYNHLVFDKIHPLLKKVVKTIPNSKLEIKPNDPCMSGGPQAYYLVGDPQGKNPGVFYVNISDVAKSSPKYEMVTLALHEALPGHHLQLSYLMEDTNLPSFRRFIEDRNYTHAPFHFSMQTSYMEGWGLYCEHLGYELGLYEDPYDNFGHLSMEMLRATRLVVDTGIHAFGWSFDRAVDYMLEHTAASKCHIEKEVKRYITLPGQACAYKVGELKLKSLRQKAEAALGSKFSVTEFHDMILRNCGSIDILEQKTWEFIAENA